MNFFFPYLEFFHYSRLNVPTFVELYLFDTIKSIKKDDVKFWRLFKKCAMVCSTSFYKNCSTYIISNPNILFCSFLPILLKISQSLWFIWSFYFQTFTTSLCFFLLDYQCTISWRGERCGVAKFMFSCWSWLRWNSINFRCRLPNASLACTKGESISCIFYLNKVLISTHFDKGSRIIILCHGLKEFLEKCPTQFQVYIWYATQCHNIYNYLDQI
jgi:hypothetical protein